jgi:hypothetical protein
MRAKPSAPKALPVEIGLQPRPSGGAFYFWPGSGGVFAGTKKSGRNRVVPGTAA